MKNHAPLFPRKIFIALAALAMAAAGCSKPFWTARFYMLKAEDRMSKAAMLKSQKIPYEGRIPYYREACLYFLRAYRSDPGIFTLGRIREAGDSCWRSGNGEGQAEFTRFEEKYAKQHPKEYEYGDTDATIPE